MLFVNQTEYGNAAASCAPTCSRPGRTSRSTRPCGSRQEVKRHADAAGPGEDVVLVFMEALGLEPPLTLVCSDLHLKMEGYPVEQGAVIEISLLPPGHRRP